METREKQRLLTLIIIVSLLAIASIIGFIIVPEIKEQNNRENVTENQDNKSNNTGEDVSKADDTNNDNKDAKDESDTNTSDNENTNNNDSVGKEEQNGETTSSNNSQTKEEKAVELAKNKWGKNDETVSFNIEQKDGKLYYVAVRKDTQVMQWYEVNTETWEIKEY